MDYNTKNDGQLRLKKLYYSRKEIANLYQITPKALRKEISETRDLLKKLSAIGYNHECKRPLHRNMVVVIFGAIGAPDGYELYESPNKL